MFPPLHPKDTSYRTDLRCNLRHVVPRLRRSLLQGGERKRSWGEGDGGGRRGRRRRKEGGEGRRRSGSGKAEVRRTSKGVEKALVAQRRVPTRKARDIKGIREQRRGEEGGEGSERVTWGVFQLSTGCCVLSVSHSFKDLPEMSRKSTV